tara:strand:- start:226 stop:387 length:162 start_codon:yes stop_codon:yes gene_type:complete
MPLKHMVVQAVVVPEEQVVIKTNLVQLDPLLVEMDMDLVEYHHLMEHQDHQDH